MYSSVVYFQLFPGTADYATFTTRLWILILTMCHEIVILQEDFATCSAFILLDFCGPLGLMNFFNMLNVATPAGKAQSTITAIVHYTF